MARPLVQVVRARRRGLLAFGLALRVMREVGRAVQGQENAMTVPVYTYDGQEVVPLPEPTEEPIRLLAKRYEDAKAALGAYMECVAATLGLEGEWDLSVADMSLVRRTEKVESDV